MTQPTTSWAEPGSILVDMNPELCVRFAVDDQVLSDLHSRAFAQPTGAPQPWAQRLERHSLTWVGAFRQRRLVGFVHACWDGGSHAFLLDTVVDPLHRREGIGRALVHRLTQEVAASGCEWLHVDYEPHLASFYEQTCGFRTTSAGLMQFTGEATPGQG
jgi:GNAT superfamily N-acetyltransferase